MPDTRPYTEEFLGCECGNFLHTSKFTAYDDGTLLLEHTLQPMFYSLWGRIKLAWRVLFRPHEVLNTDTVVDAEKFFEASDNLRNYYRGKY